MRTDKDVEKIYGKRLLSSKLVQSNMNFILLLATISLYMIFNSHRAEKKLMQIHHLRKEIKLLEYEYSDLKKKLKKKTMLSRLEKELEDVVVFPEKGATMVGPGKS